MDNTDTSRIIVESVAQYLARGGKVTVGPSVHAKGFVDALIKVKAAAGGRPNGRSRANIRRRWGGY